MEEIIDRYREKEICKEQVLQELMTQFGSQVKRLAYIYVKDMQTAEDISQEVFIKCYNKLDQYKGKSTVKSWVNRITVNQCKDYLRSGWIKNMSLNSVFDLFKSREGSPESEITLKASHDELTEKVLSLPLKYREATILYYYQELSVSEICELLHTKPATIRTRLQRARALLKESYKKEDSI